MMIFCDLGELFNQRGDLGSPFSPHRTFGNTASFAWVKDTFQGAVCQFLRFKPGAPKLVIHGQYKIKFFNAGGWLVSPNIPTESTYWIPKFGTCRRVDAVGRILDERQAAIVGLEATSSSLSVEFGASEEFLDLIVWQMTDQELVSELNTLNQLERQPWFLWGSHTVYARPADIYQHLIYGHVYENRSSWPHYWKICSENDAHALYVVLTGLFRATGKRIYDLLRCQVTLSVIDRLGEDGAFRHGEWSKNMESHYRLHASGMHLIMDHLAEHDDAASANALARAASFLASRPDHTSLGAWFLHDDLEQSPETMRQNPFAWKSSRVLGKSPCNMLVLNTHLDTLIGLDRFGRQSGNSEYADLVSSAVQAAHKVLALRPAEALYRIVSSVLYLAFLPSMQAAKLPSYKRAIKRFGWKWLAPRFHRLKTAFPRLVMPDGYIDRALSIKGVSDAYQSINLMDLLRFVRRFPDAGVDQLLHEALAFTHSSGLVDRWSESPKKAYAMGFWAEALWHACTLYANSAYRVWLAEAVLKLESKKMGLPPSLMGANSEALPVSLQRPCPMPNHPHLRVANLCMGEKRELLVVNPTGIEIELSWVTPLDRELRWTDPQGRLIEAPPNVPAQGWLHGSDG